MVLSSSVPRIDILMAGRTLPPIRERFGDFDRWFQERPEAPASFRVHRLFDGDPIPTPSGSDAWIITGSSDSVNDDLPWLPAVKDGLARVVNEEHPVLGVCFGHQLLAVATDGRVERNPKGWELGPAIVSFTGAGSGAPLFQGMDTNIPVYQTHQEMVVSLPPGAQVLAANEMGLQAFQLGPRAFGVQFHPEFTAEITHMYIALRSGRDWSAVSGELEIDGDDSKQVLTNFIQNVTL